VFHLVAGWYFATLIASDALEVKPWDDAEFTIVAVSDGLVTIDAGDEDTKDLLRDDVLGVDFGTGYGQLGPVTEVKDDTTVTRPYTHLAGTKPTAGLDATLHGVAYPRISGVADLPEWSEVTVEAPFGDFPAWLAGGESKTWAITVHGRGAHRDEALRILPTLTDAGLSTLMISYRNDEGAPATDDRLAAFGVTEWEDLEAAVRFALDRGASDVILVGFSMGGAISMAFLEESDLAGRVSGVILEAPAIDLAEMVANRAGDTDLIPGVPWKVPITLTVSARQIAGLMHGVNWAQLSYVDRPGSIQVPALIIHGDADGTVPLSVGEQLATRLGEAATFEVFEGADHVRSWNVDPERYQRIVGDFLAGLGGE
jgi:alpha-beta hydrolase superfamily lysophospholipase